MSFHGNLEGLGEAIRALMREEIDAAIREEAEVDHITEGVVVIPLEGRPYICSL